jgi:hypothetical protein
MAVTAVATGFRESGQGGLLLGKDGKASRSGAKLELQTQNQNYHDGMIHN